jgi:hypothetical protein
MQISVVQSGYGSVPSLGESNSFAKVKKTFDALGSALDSGNLDEAKKAFDQLEKYGPPQNGKSSPLTDTIDSLGKALNSGDLKSAQDAYDKIESALSQRPPAGGQGRRPAGAAGANSASNVGGNSQSNKTYDAKDINKDGTVSAQEEFLYDISHSQESKKSQSTSITSGSTDDAAANEMAAIQIRIDLAG